MEKDDNEYTYPLYKKWIASNRNILIVYRFDDSNLSECIIGIEPNGKNDDEFFVVGKIEIIASRRINISGNKYLFWRYSLKLKL